LEPDRHELVLLLPHAHLPKLAETDLVEWEYGRETVRYVPVDVIKEVLAALDEPSD